MQAKEVHNNPELCMRTWIKAAERAILSCEELRDLGLHKQICNRVIEPYQYIKTIVTATEYDNWFWLRDHGDADPTIKKLAQDMWNVLQLSHPQRLHHFEYHVPYVDTKRCPHTNVLEYWSGDKLIDVEEAIKISTSCCAQVSYRVLDDSLEKALDIYDKLVTMSPVHASPFEHVCNPMAYPTIVLEGYWDVLDRGEHVDSKGNIWSGNFKGWSQYRQEIPNNACWDLDKFRKDNKE
jgi:hypothetical protein